MKSSISTLCKGILSNGTYFSVILIDDEFVMTLESCFLIMQRVCKVLSHISKYFL